VFAERLLHEPGSSGRRASLGCWPWWPWDGPTRRSPSLAGWLVALPSSDFAEELHAATLLFDADSARLGGPSCRAWARLADEFDGRAADRRRRAAWMVAVLDRGAFPLRRSAAERAAGRRAATPHLGGAVGGRCPSSARRVRAALASTRRPRRRPPLHGRKTPSFARCWHSREPSGMSEQGNSRTGSGADLARELRCVSLSDRRSPGRGGGWAFAHSRVAAGPVGQALPGSSEGACRAYRTVVRLWPTAEPRYARGPTPRLNGSRLCDARLRDRLPHAGPVDVSVNGAGAPPRCCGEEPRAPRLPRALARNAPAPGASDRAAVG